MRSDCELELGYNPIRLHVHLFLSYLNFPMLGIIIDVGHFVEEEYSECDTG